MTDKSKIAPPRQRMHAVERDWSADPAKGLKLWYHERVWRAAFKEAEREEGLSPDQIELIDTMNLFVQGVNASEAARASAYNKVVYHVRMFDPATVTLWKDVIRAEYLHAEASGSFQEYKSRFEDSYHFQFFLDEADLFREGYYLHYAGNARFLTNAIRTTSARDRNGKPLVFTRYHRELLLPHYRLHDELDDRDRLEAVGVLRLHYAWKTTSDSEKQKIKRFVAAHAHEMDVAISIISSRFVDSLDHLETLMDASSAPALIEGAL